MANIVIATEKDFDKIVKSVETVLVDFYATWCPPCKMLAPFVEEIAEEYDGKVKVCKVDVDQVETLAYKFNVRSIPTLIYFKDGKVSEVNVGFQSKESIKEKIDSLLK